jgi:hypothetical protein
MAVLLAQVSMSLTVLAFAIAALRVAGALPGHARGFSYAWRLTGWALLVAGTNSLGHDVFAIIGYRGGPDSRAWAAVLQWHPVLNHSRTFLLTTYCVVLAVVLYRARTRGVQPPPVRRAMALVVGGMILGGVVGWIEPVFTTLFHYSAVAVLDIMELIAIMGLLAVGMSGGMDRALWIAMGTNGFVSALSVLLFAAVSQIDVPQQWWPHPLYVQTAKVVLHALMVVVAVRHLYRIRQGKPVRALLDAPREAVGVPSLNH